LVAKYITTPIYYPNSPPHIGHAYTTVYADVLARYSRLIGEETFFMTGNDEHGYKLQKAAEEKNVDPKTFVDEMAEVYKRYWSMLDISYDHFIRTTDEYHEKVVKQCIEKIYRDGYIYKGEYKGWYCVSCEKFYSEKEYKLVNGKPYCPIHDKPLEWIEEETYYFRLSDFKDYLVNLLENSDIIYPKTYAIEVMNRIKEEGLRDLSIARPSERVWWGIKLPFDEKYTIYVWFDALLNYVSGIGYLMDNEKFNKYWSNVHHVIGKDILWFHTTVWFSVLRSLDIPPPKKVLVHAFLINRGLKIGKSSGNVINIEDVLNRYHGSDGVRYILMRIFNLEKDVDITSIDLLDSIYNNELVDTYGNLVRRVGVLANKKVNGIVYKRSIDDDIESLISNILEKYGKSMEEYNVSQALNTAMDLVREANAYINREKPWEKSSPYRDLYSLLEMIRFSTIMLYPVIPRSAQIVAKAYGFELMNPYKLTVGGVERFNISDAPILFKKTK